MITSCVLSSAVPVIGRTGVPRINLINLSRNNVILFLCIWIQRWWSGTRKIVMHFYGNKYGACMPMPKIFSEQIFRHDQFHNVCSSPKIKPLRKSLAMATILALGWNYSKQKGFLSYLVERMIIELTIGQTPHENTGACFVPWPGGCKKKISNLSHKSAKLNLVMRKYLFPWTFELELYCHHITLQFLAFLQLAGK